MENLSYLVSPTNLESKNVQDSCYVEVQQARGEARLPTIYLYRATDACTCKASDYQMSGSESCPPCEPSKVENLRSSKLPLSPIVTSSKSLHETNAGMPRNDGIIYADPFPQSKPELKCSYSPSVYSFRPVQVASWRSLKDAALFTNHLFKKSTNNLQNIDDDSSNRMTAENEGDLIHDKTKQPLRHDLKEMKKNAMKCHGEGENEMKDDIEEDEEDWSLTVAERRAEFESMISNQNENGDFQSRKIKSSNGMKPIRLPGMVTSEKH